MPRSRTSDRRNRERSAFTLIELLVVIGIIAILMGILLPVTGKIREKGKMTDCLGQIRQIGIAINGYANDYADHLPVCSRLEPLPLYRLPSLAQVLKPYLETGECFHCPADTGADALFATCGSRYEWNTFVCGKKIDRATMSIIGLEITLPILGDAERFHTGFGRNYLYPDGRVTQSLEVLIRDD